MSGKSFNKTAKDLSPVLFEPPKKGERVIYNVKREAHDAKDEDILKKLKIRYDETTIYPVLIGRELPKTFGHYHPQNYSGVYYPEIYSVLEGRAWYLMQKPEESNPKVIQEIYLVEAKKNEKIVLPPGFGNTTISPDKNKLKMANFVASVFENEYHAYENLRGAAYYLFESKSGDSADFEKNSYYESVPEIVKLKPKVIPQLGIDFKTPLYEMIKNPANLKFLTKPEKYLQFLTIENCFEKI